MSYSFRVLAVTMLGLLIVMPTTTSVAQGAKARVQVPSFVEEADAAGIDHVYDGGWEFFVGGGVAAFDCDGDRRPDLYFAGGENAASLYRNQSPGGGSLAFDHVADPTTDLTLVTGAYPLDIDGDGHTDLVVLRRGENVLLRGTGDCAFERANENWGFDGGDSWTTAFSATWEDGSLLPTLAFGDYLALVEPNEPIACAESSLFRPDAASTAYGDPFALAPGHCTLSVLFSDWDRSGQPDLRVTNDRQYYLDGEEQLWRIEPDGPPTMYTRKDGWRQLNIWGMGIASEDITGDGYPEVYLTSMGDNKLQTLAAGPDGPRFRDIAHERRATVPTPFAGGDLLPSTAWHAEFADVNNDRMSDLFVSKGNVDSMPDHATNDPNNLLLGMPDGRFKEAAGPAGILDYGRGRGAALVDLNLDGLLDIVEVVRRENVRVRRNVGSGDAAGPLPMGRWIALRLRQDGRNVDAVGAWLEVRTAGETVSREITVGGGHAGGALGWTHIGLGKAKKARLRVHWPDGARSSWMRADAGGFYDVVRDQERPARWLPPAPSP